MIKATYILLNIGLVPLLASFDGFLGLMYIAFIPLTMIGTDESHRFRENFPNNKVLRGIHTICALLIVLATGLLIGAGTLTGSVNKASLQSALYKIGYFDFLAVFVVVVLLAIRVYFTQQNKVKYPHLMVSPSII